MKVVLFIFSAGALLAQTVSVTGVVVRIDSGNLTLKPDSGAEVNLALQPTVSFRRVAPGETNLQNAAKLALADIQPGDRVLARGTSPGTAALVVVMSQADLAKKQAAERADWEKRGIAGVITGVDPLTVNLRGTPVRVTLAGNAIVRRYAPDSIRFADARVAQIADFKAGDQVRLRGDRTAESMTAEEIVGGTFRTLAATVQSAAGNEIQITDLETKKKLTLSVSSETSIHKLDAQTAQSIAGRANAKGKGTTDLTQAMERSAAIRLADLKSGDALVIVSTGSAAVTIVAGVEPILTKPGTQQMSLGSWNIDLGAGVP